MDARRWRRFLVAGLTGTALLFVTPAGLQPILTLALSIAGLVALKRGTRAWAEEVHRGAGRARGAHGGHG